MQSTLLIGIIVVFFVVIVVLLALVIVKNKRTKEESFINSEIETPINTMDVIPIEETGINFEPVDEAGGWCYHHYIKVLFRGNRSDLIKSRIYYPENVQLHNPTTTKKMVISGLVEWKDSKERKYLHRELVRARYDSAENSYYWHLFRIDSDEYILREELIVQPDN